VRLDLSGNELYAQQDNYDVINQLVSLETLIVKNNKFSFFQKEIAQLTKLKILDVQDNNISPRQLKRLQGYLPKCEMLASERSKKKKKK
jgi:Leucine-rich repeat (LRR) protein